MPEQQTVLVIDDEEFGLQRLEAVYFKGDR